MKKKEIFWDMIAASRAGAKIEQLGKQSLAHRKQAGAEYERSMKERPEHVAHCLGMLFGGQYGRDEMHFVRRHVLITRGNANKVATASALIAGFEWSCTHADAVAAWKRLTVKEQGIIDKALAVVIEEATAKAQEE